MLVKFIGFEQTAKVLMDITNIDKIYDKVGQKFRYLCNLIGCEAQEEAG